MNKRVPLVVAALACAAFLCAVRGTGQQFDFDPLQANRNANQKNRNALQINGNAAPSNRNGAKAAGGAAGKGKPRAKPSAPFVIFAVSKFESGAVIEPVVVVNRGAFAKPPIEGDETSVKTFVDEYFKEGRKYRILSGGGNAGTATVVKYQEQGCVGLAADATVQTQVKLGGEVQALATSSEALGNQTPSRRAPTDLERIVAREQARIAYTRSGVGATLTNNMEVVNLTATDLDGDGKFELIGSFRIDRKRKGSVEDSYNLFIIFEPEGELMKPALTWYHHGAEGQYEDRRLVDQVDIDGDGQSEVVVEGHYYESNDYIIYKKQQGQWRSVYQGGGGGC